MCQSTYCGSDCVIYDSSFSVHSWAENWVWQIRSQVHPKIRIVIYFLVSQDNEWSPTLNWKTKKNPYI